MPPRIPPVLHNLTSNLCNLSAPRACYPIPSIQVATKTTIASRRKHRDPYTLAQIKQRKNANISRQKVLQEQRKVSMGDPVRGMSTPFLESLDTVEGCATGQLNSKAPYFNHFLTREEIEVAYKNSYDLSLPDKPDTQESIDPEIERERLESHKARHDKAIQAIERIISLSNASSKDKTRTNIIRCIEKFGRHKTDQHLKPRPAINPLVLGNATLPTKTPRAGPDTGSSEVQIAILTAKIRVLANKLEEPGGKRDKINKRNLRVMVHKRQKLLRYLRKKERGGERWQHLVKTLGLTDGTWMGEISL
ncbi:Bgt-3125 [Blumeria graminis f. sp. tritici]|uniref:Bgt-3125 n=2 Tax=Blumeria graminis f. sp. tritici TaxID=62690 RepID=A0A381L5J7_BLUGR|nr:hypothetical protein BGT96224_3125 [Blumeria graminis f. sp. tritici 96224]VDB89380.1 Bgt-3125 [Blumeria graminis f. sp. tritici]